MTSKNNGNSCGHAPENPRWFTPPEQHNRPHIIKKMLEEIRAYYKNPALTIPSLNLANGSSRQQRSERREGCTIVLGCLMHYVDLATLRVGIPQADGQFSGITMEFIAKKCTLSMRRTERAVADLVTSGLVTVYPLCEKLDETAYKGFAAIRTLSTKLFSLFGLGKRLGHEREKAAQRQKRRQAKSEAKSRAKISLLAQMGERFKTESVSGSPASQAFKIIKTILNSS